MRLRCNPLLSLGFQMRRNLFLSVCPLNKSAARSSNRSAPLRIQLDAIDKRDLHINLLINAERRSLAERPGFISNKFQIICDGRQTCAKHNSRSQLPSFYLQNCRTAEPEVNYDGVATSNLSGFNAGQNYGEVV